ncbi:MAG: hypothetical protein HQL40_02265 [Alphaproteobacteria bacterium]|nr:hypothetical protein [Alphaproteobacteria bacterium]
MPVGLEVGEAAGHHVDTHATAGDRRSGGEMIRWAGFVVGKNDQHVEIAVRPSDPRRAAAKHEDVQRPMRRHQTADQEREHGVPVAKGADGRARPCPHEIKRGGHQVGIVLDGVHDIANRGLAFGLHGKGDGRG